MRDPSHMKKVELWAQYVRGHPRGWRKQLNPFIDAQIRKANEFYSRLLESPEGREKIKKIKKLRAKGKSASTPTN